MLVSSGKFYCGSKSKERKGLMFSNTDSSLLCRFGYHFVLPPEAS